MNQTAKGFKLLVSYEVKPEVQNEYYQFIMGQYLPAMQSRGLQMSDAWHTAYGNAPNRMLGFVCADSDTMVDLLASETWTNLNTRLEEFVTELDYKVIPYRGGFQL